VQKWEYLHVRVDHQEVGMVNGQQLGEFKAGTSMRVKGQDLHEMLSQAGEDGWDLVSHKMPNVGTEVFVFRRPAPTPPNRA
jgi:hypothetical protein